MNIRAHQNNCVNLQILQTQIMQVKLSDFKLFIANKCIALLSGGTNVNDIFLFLCSLVRFQHLFGHISASVHLTDFPG